MKRTVVRALATLPGVAMLINGVGMVTTPAQAVGNLGMPLLDGIGRSTQLGDFTGFFLAIAGFVCFGVLRSQAHWLYAAAWLLALAGGGRLAAFAINGAALPGALVAAEFTLALWLAACGHLLGRSRRDSASPGATPSHG